LVPVFCAGTVLGTGNLSRALRVIVLLFLIGYESWFLKFTPEAWSKLKHGNVYLASRDLGEHLKDTAAAAAVFQWGSDTGMYFYSQKSPPTSAFYVQPLLEGPLAPKLTEKTLRELERVSPELVVIDPKVTGITPPEYPIRNWIETNYSLKESFAGYHILQRNK
jgi:hypothetical protein